MTAGLPPGVVLMDAGYGNDTALRDGVTALELTYVAGVQSSLTVWPPGVEPLPPKPWSGRGRPPRLWALPALRTWSQKHGRRQALRHQPRPRRRRQKISQTQAQGRRMGRPIHDGNPRPTNPLTWIRCPASSTPSVCSRPTSNPPSAASAIPMITPWPKPSTVSTRPNSSTGGDLGNPSRLSNTPPSNGSIGSTTADGSNPSQIFRQPSPSDGIMLTGTPCS